MCDPISLAVGSFVVAGASAVTSYQGQQQAASNQDAYRAANTTNANSAAVYDYQQIALRQMQEEEAAGTKNFDNMLGTRSKAATAEVSAGEAGITGLSVDSLIADIYQKGGTSSDRLSRNKEMTLTQLNAEKNGVNATRVNRINSVQPGVQPSGLALGLNIAGAAVNSASGYRSATR